MNPAFRCGILVHPCSSVFIRGKSDFHSLIHSFTNSLGEQPTARVTGDGRHRRMRELAFRRDRIELLLTFLSPANHAETKAADDFLHHNRWHGYESQA